jgi:HAD superfamily phosphoserine phosphatase-like hydrolase
MGKTKSMTAKPKFDFPNEKFQQVIKSCEKALEDGAHPIAAFDADGTLWATDMGESFFIYQIENCPLTDLPSNPWSYYKTLHGQNPEAAYLWLAQINKGRSLQEVRRWAQKCVDTHPDVGFFEGQKKLIKKLKDMGVNVFVVTASIKWAVEPAAELMGIPRENVLGIETTVENGLITELQKGVITYKQGKVAGIQSASSGILPFFASGNSNGDLHLLESASHVKFVVSSAKEDHHLFEIEQNMIEHAKNKRWHFHEF